MEKWKNIENSEVYEVSTLGRVRSWLRKGRGNWRMPTPRILKGRINQGGYRCINIAIDGKYRSRIVHHLVAEAYIGERPDGMHIDHIDGDKLNNSVDNLEYVTPRQNTQRYHESVDTTSEKMGVSWVVKNNIWRAEIRAYGVRHYLIDSADEQLCADVYKAAVEAVDGDEFEEFMSDLAEYRSANRNPRRNMKEYMHLQAEVARVCPKEGGDV